MPRPKPRAVVVAQPKGNAKAGTGWAVSASSGQEHDNTKILRDLQGIVCASACVANLLLRQMPTQQP